MSRFGGEVPLYYTDVPDFSVKFVVATENDFKCANVASTQISFILLLNSTKSTVDVIKYKQ